MALPQEVKTSSTRMPERDTVCEIGGRITRTIRPGQKGAQRFTAEYGDALVRVHYARIPRADDATP